MSSDNNISRVHLHSDGDYWSAFWTDGNGERHRKGIGSKAKLSRRQATAKCRSLEAEIARSPLARAGSKAPALSVWLDRYLSMRTELKPASVTIYQRTNDMLIEFFEDLPIDQITRSGAADWRAWLAGDTSSERAEWPTPGRGLGDSTTCKYVRVAKAAFGERYGAMKEDLIAINPFDRERGKDASPEQNWRELTLD